MEGHRLGYMRVKLMVKKRSRKAEHDAIEAYITRLSDEAEPKTHCCECTPGEHFQRHFVHIQYQGCQCDPKKYILNKNEE